MLLTRPLYRLAAIAVLACSQASSAQTGDLDPPAGPIIETMKPLDVVEARTPVGPDTTPGDAANVYVIDRPGSYPWLTLWMRPRTSRERRSLRLSR